MIEIVQATSASHIQDVRELMFEFVQWAATLNPIEDVPAFEGFDDELRKLPGIFAPPRGRLLLALDNGVAAGCVCLKPVEDSIGELKRMYVRPTHRGQGIGGLLGRAVVDVAREIGYTRLILDSHRSMTGAHAIYHGLGFVDIEPPPDVPEFVRELAIFMQLDMK
jgi:GNAT superfamily N-acetyltransferase